MNLSIHDVDPATAERIRARALRLLERRTRLAARPTLARAERLWARFLEPALVAAAGLVYIGWALGRVTRLISG